jgi:hypothetical protein
LTKSKRTAYYVNLLAFVVSFSQGVQASTNCMASLLSAIEADYNADKSSGIARPRQTPINIQDWEPTAPVVVGSFATKSTGASKSKLAPRVAKLRALSEAEQGWVNEEIQSINSMVEGAFVIPEAPRVVVAVDGEGFYIHEEHLIAVPAAAISRENRAGLNVGVFHHEYGHAIYAANDPHTKGNTSWESGYDEVFADSLALMRFPKVHQMKEQGGAFAANISPKGWMDREEHQIFIPARSALGQALFRFPNQAILSTQQRQRFLRTVFDSGIQEREHHRAKLASDLKSPRQLDQSPESLNVSLISRFGSIFP